MKKKHIPEWRRVIALAEACAFAEDEEQGKKTKRNYLAFLRKLLARYGRNPDILASLADFYCSDKKAIPLLEEAYRLAEESGDGENLAMISHSLAERYLDRPHPDVENGLIWLTRLKEHLVKCPDEDLQECCLKLCDMPEISEKI